MPAWTPAERRGALLVATLLALGAARDLWRATHPRWTPPAAPVALAAQAGAARQAAPSARAGPAADSLVDLNHASAAQLDALPGIGPVLAGRILERRTALGGFRSPEDLLGVPGIGPRLYERLRTRVSTGVAPAAPGTAAVPGR